MYILLYYYMNHFYHKDFIKWIKNYQNKYNLSLKNLYKLNNFILKLKCFFTKKKKVALKKHVYNKSLQYLNEFSSLAIDSST